MRAWIAFDPLRVWVQAAKPERGALRIDPRIVSPEGAAATASVVLAPHGVSVPFDDLAVQHARRRLLAERPFDAVTTFLHDASHFAGSLVVARGADQLARLRDEPFARLFPARVVEVPAGLLGTTPWPAGPVIERYGSANPWPADRF